MNTYKNSLTHNNFGTAKKFFYIFGIALIIIGLGIAFTFMKNKKVSGNDVVDKVSKMYVIQDKSKAKAIEIKEITDEQKKSSSIYKDLKPGDYFIQLEDKGRVIIYRPSEGKILRVDPLIEQKVNIDPAKKEWFRLVIWK